MPSTPPYKNKLIACLTAGTAAFACTAAHAAQEPGLNDLVELSLEQLSSITVTSVSRQEQSLSAAATSIYVISGYDIERAGVRSIPEALRLAPNLQVAKVDARNYAVTARGFNSAFENKLLVLIDGRSIYTPLFSGVFWDAQDVVMEDIERIEVISGPGATIWGANAVNGVINIITRSAKDTQGGLASVGASNQEKLSEARYGGRLDNGGYYRVYGKFADADDTFTQSGADTHTGWHRSQTGFRTDWERAAQAFTMQGDAYTGRLGQTGTADIKIAGANLIGRMTEKLGDGSSLRLQAYWDHTQRDQPLAFVEHLDTLDLEAQRSQKLGESHNLTWGGGYRHAWDRVDNGPNFSFLPGSLHMHWANVFAQDEIAVHKDWRLTAGLKFEHNNYTDWETLPSLRLAWTPDDKRLVWSALSRTVRSPSRIDRDFYSPSNPPVVGGVARYGIAGGPDFESETANVFELGYRAQPNAAYSYSLTAFYSDYSHLRTLEPSPGGAIFRNMGAGTARGIEGWGTWNVARNWRLRASWVEQRIGTRLEPGSQDATAGSGLATNDPQRYITVRSSHDLSASTRLDMNLRYVGSLPKPFVPSYYELDMSLGWKPAPDWELSLVGSNLLHASHPEFGSVAGRSVIERQVFLQLLYHFR